jgi:hypothetical protein
VNPWIIVTVAVAWLAGMFIAWALVHGAQILRREEAAHIASEAVAPEELATIQPIAPEADRLPAAA